MIKRLIWTIWTPMSSVLKKADKLNLSLSLSQTPQCIRQIFHNAPLFNRIVHISVTKWCIVGYGTGALWDLWGWSISLSDPLFTFKKCFEVPPMFYFRNNFSLLNVRILHVLFLFKLKGSIQPFERAVKLYLNDRGMWIFYHCKYSCWCPANLIFSLNFEK